MTTLPNCPKCKSEYTYEDGDHLVCPECAYEWTAESKEIVEELIGKEKDYIDYDISFWGVDYDYMYKLTEVYYNERLDIIVAWQWDSDGTLLIKENEKAAINRDCKCSNEWNWI